MTSPGSAQPVWDCLDYPRLRGLLLDGTMDWLALGTAALIAMAVVVVGQFVFDRLQWKFAEAL